MFKNQKGITLVALVITIVVLIILAAVTINFALGGNLLDRAQQGADMYQDAADEEDSQLTNIQAFIDSLNVLKTDEDGE